MKDPLEEYEQEKEAQKENRKEQELHHWREWDKKGRQAEHLQPLLDAYEPNFNHKVRQWKAPTVTEGAFKGELYKQFINAMHTFDPSRGVALNTHVENRLHKAKRFNAQHQNMAYIPEWQIDVISPIDKAHNSLTEELGRSPTHQEIADHINELGTGPKRLTAKRVRTIQESRRKDIPGSMLGGEAGSELAPSLYEEQQIEIARNLLPQLFPNKPEIHTLFRHTFGVDDHKKITSTTELAKAMGKSQPQISRLKTQMGNVLRSQFYPKGSNEE